jgi:hypothetical protein
MRRFKLSGKFLRILFVHYRKQFHGQCDPPQQKPREIWIDRRLAGQKLLEIVLHEAIHARLWRLKERDVREFARDLARLIYRLGFKECSDAKEQRKRKSREVWRNEPDEQN